MLLPYLPSKQTEENKLNSTCLADRSDGETSAYEGISNPPAYISKHGHREPRKYAEQAGFSEVEFQDLHKQ